MAEPEDNDEAVQDVAGDDEGEFVGAWLHDGERPVLWGISDPV